MYSWIIKTLYKNGKVNEQLNMAGNPQPPDSQYFAATYNQGVFIGASYMLYEITKNNQYITYALNAADWTRNNFTVYGGILPPEIFQGIGNIGPALSCDDKGFTTFYLLKRIGNNTGFKAIFCRYMGQFINFLNLNGKTQKATGYLNWMQKNVDTAWNHRDKKTGLMWSIWERQFPTYYLKFDWIKTHDQCEYINSVDINAWGAACLVSLMHNIEPNNIESIGSNSGTL